MSRHDGDSTDEIPSLVNRYRTAVESRCGVSLDPMRPGLDADGFRALEAELGFEVPSQLKALFSYADGGHVAYGNPLWPAATIKEGLDSIAGLFWLVADAYEGDPEQHAAPLGTPPPGDAIPIRDSDMQSVWVGAGGADDNVVYAYHSRPIPAPTAYAWVVIAPSLMAFLRASAEVAEAGGLIARMFDNGTRLSIMIDETHRRADEIWRSHGIDPDILF